MLERYFTEEGVEISDVKDNNTSLTFTCTHPDWTSPRTLTLSDLGIAKALGIEPKEFSRQDFVKTLKDLFVKSAAVYFCPEKDFPIPAEWKDSAKSLIASLKESRMFTTVDASYVRDINPPLYGLCVLEELKNTYMNTPSDGPFPVDLERLLANPDSLFEEIEED